MKGYRGGTRKAGSGPCIDCRVALNMEGSLRCEFCHRKARAASASKYRNSLPGARKELAKARIRLRSYGLTTEEYAGLLKKQGGRCAICRVSKAGGRANGSWYVDHCHETKRVRGLLCSNCNTGLGHFRDNPTLLKAAVAYLVASA